ncbi:MAG: threonine/serine dehydratase [Acidimicrobiia bacterium]|nr:threonine/serine dehydratase [Acidimicrobiia bacterium]
MIHITQAEIAAAHRRIEPYVHRTPIVTSSFVDDLVGAKVFFKCENLQKVGAFKARGATNAVLSLDAATAARGVVTHSSGNHGQAVAYACGIRGIPATVVMPDDAAAVKIDAVRGYGADVVLVPRDQRDARVAHIIASDGLTLVHPFNDTAVIAGQATASLELIEDVPDLDVILAPIGGGGLMSGTSLVAAAFGIEAVGVEPALVDDAFRSLRDGIRYPATGELSVGDGLLTGLGEITFAILSAAGIEVILVSEDEILDAVRTIAMRMKLVVEPSGATVVAALLTERDRFSDKRVGVILSGGNLDLARLAP